MKLIANKLTKMSALEVLKAFRSAYTLAQGTPPSNSTLAILVAQSALECGRWASMHCFNFGNMRPPKNWNGGYCQFRCNEKIDGKWVWFDPPSAGSNFLAFESAPDGALYYMQKLMQTWPEAWLSAVQGNTTGFVHGLKKRGYFTADEAPYLHAVQKLCSEFFDYISRGLLDDAPTSAEYHEPSAEAVDAAASRVIVAPALLIGAKGPAVGAWQQVVDVATDGAFGPATEAATRTWQLAHGLPVTGWVSENDLQAAGLLSHDGANT